MHDDVYYSGEQDDVEPATEERFGIYEAEEESNFEDWEEEVPVDPVFEEEFNKQQVELKRKEGELKKVLKGFET